MQKLPVIIIYLLIAVAFIIFLAVAIPKILFPYQIHYMEGSMLDAVSRTLGGVPIYSKPSIYYIPWLYPPLYYYITAAITEITGLTFFTARLTSVFSTIALCVILYWVVRKETGKSLLALCAPGLLIAAYAKTEFCLFMARIDPLFTFLTVAAAVTIYYSRSNFGLISGALLLALSYFTKQTGLFFAPTIIFYLWYIRGWKQMVIFSSTLIVIIFAGVYALDAYYGGWYSYYTFVILQSKGKTLRWEYAIEGFTKYIFLRCWWVSTLLSARSLKRIFTKSSNNCNEASVYFGLFFINSIVVGFMGILNAGGEHNVLLPAAAACGLFMPIIVHELSLNRKFTRFALWLLPVQLLFLISFPWREPFNIAGEAAKKKQEESFAFARSISGDVWIPFQGYVQKYIGKGASTEIDPMRDVFLVDDTVARQLHDEVDTALQHEHWSHILSEFSVAYPHYRFVEAILNQNRATSSDTILYYVYKPSE